MEPAIRKKVVTASAVLAGLLLISVVLMVIVSRNRHEDEAGGGVPPAVEVDAFALHAEYARNTAAADEKYRHRRLRVRGQVFAIEPVSGKYAVGVFAPPKMLHGGGFEEPGAAHDRLQAAIAKAEAERDKPRNVEPGVVAIFAGQSEVAKLRNDDALVVEGICAGREESRGRNRGIWIVIDHATVVPAAPPHPVESHSQGQGKTKTKNKGPARPPIEDQ